MQLITPEEVLGLAFSADDAIDPAHVRAARIEAAQLRYIRPAFGAEMYRKMILEQYGSFVSGYIKPALAHYVRYEMIGELAVRASDRGVVRPASEERLQTTASTQSGEQKRTDTTKQESSRLQSSEKSTSGTTGRTTTGQSTVKRVSEETSLAEGSDQRTITVTDSEKTTMQSSVTDQTDTSIAMTLTEKKETDQTNGTKETLDTTSHKQEETKQGTRTDTTSDTQEVNGTETGTAKTDLEQTDTAMKTAAVSTTSQNENSGTGTTTRTSLGAATPEEWQLLSRQALRDARTFLRYAVEYVEAHRELFPEYAPASGLGASAARRCIGGIIL